MLGLQMILLLTSLQGCKYGSLGSPDILFSVCCSSLKSFKSDIFISTTRKDGYVVTLLFKSWMRCICDVTAQNQALVAICHLPQIQF